MSRSPGNANHNRICKGVVIARRSAEHLTQGVGERSAILTKIRSFWIELGFLARRSPVRRKLSVLAFDPPPQAADALHGEFVVQHAHDAGEFYPLQQRNCWVLS